MRCFKYFLSTEASLRWGADAVTEQRPQSHCHDDGHGGNGHVLVQRQADDRGGVPKTPECLSWELLRRRSSDRSQWCLWLCMSQKVCDGGDWESPFNPFVMLFERKSGWMLSPNVRICQTISTYCSSFPWKSTTYCTSSLTRVLVRQHKCISQCQVTKKCMKKY